MSTLQLPFGSTIGELVSSAQVQGRKRRSAVMSGVFFLATAFAVVFLAVLLITVFQDGSSRLSFDLLTKMPSRRPLNAGFESAVVGTIWVISLTALFAFPVGVGAAIYLEEYAAKSTWTTILQTNIANLAGVPSVVYGLLGLGLFVEAMNLGRSVIAGALTMALLILPIIIISSQEALRAVPLSLRQAAFGLGATKWQVVRHHVLPAAAPGVLTGTILALSRAIGETAPLLVVGASAFAAFNPDGLRSSFTVLPIQIYRWTANAQTEFKELAAAGIIVLLVVLLVMNAAAIVLRERFSRGTRW
jgi:phosphate transport system permease protein